MTQTQLLSTFADLLAYDDGSDRRYELTNGELAEVPPESDENVLVARALDRALSTFVSFERVRSHQLALAVPGLFVLKPLSPDLLLTKDGFTQIG